MKRPALGHLLGYTALTLILTAGAAQSLTGTNTVDSGDIIDGAVTTPDIRANAVTQSRIADNGVSSSEIANNSVTGTDIADGTVGPNELAPLPAAGAARTSGSQSIPSGVGTDLIFTAELFDSAGMFNLDAPDRLTVTRTGTYVLTGGAIWNLSASGGDLTVAFGLPAGNGIGATDLPEEAHGTGGVRQNVSAVVRLNAGDFVTLRVFQDSGASRDISFASKLTFLSAAWVGP